MAYNRHGSPSGGKRDFIHKYGIRRCKLRKEGDDFFQFAGNQSHKTVEQLPLQKTVGWAYVAHEDGFVLAEDAHRILENAKKANPESAKRILIGGKVTVTEEAARVFAEAKIDLLGNESQTVGPEDSPMQVHLTLLGAEVVLLEGIRLGDVPTGVYLLSAAPLSLAGSDGAPCRAVLMELWK